jgi:hypothetical protein
MPPRTSRGIKRLESRFFGDGERLPAETESAVRRSNPAQQTRPAAAGRGGGDKGRAWMGGSDGGWARVSLSNRGRKEMGVLE